jgi:hypothetical protein
MPADVELGTKHNSGPPGSRVDTPPSLQRETSTTAESTTGSPLTVFAGSFDRFYKDFNDENYRPRWMVALVKVAWEIMLMEFRTTRSDWLAWETARDPLEVAIPAFDAIV